jgi:hypothetical protein
MNDNFIFLNGSELFTIVKNSFKYSYSFINENDLGGFERKDDKGYVDLKDYICEMTIPIEGCDLWCYEFVV